nr:MAG TPA: helix-turn-helix domain protein [Caudoviricetes sp.]
MIYSVCAERRADCLEKKTGAETELIGAAARRGQRKKRVDAGRKRNSAAAATAVNARPDGMPPEVEFIKEPGYMYDLLSMFVLYFNKEYFLSNMINYDKASADQEYYKSIIKEIEPVSNDLRIFFLMNANAKAFMMINYFDAFHDNFLTTYCLQEVQDALRDCESVKSKILEFYLPKLSKMKREECKNDLAELSRQMKIADLKPEIKNGLYSFFIEPEATLQKLAYELISKDFILKKKRESHVLLAEQTQKDFKAEEVIEKIAKYQNEDINLTSPSKLYITLSMINKNVLNYYYYSSITALLFGTDCLSYLEYISGRETAPDLETFGNALSDKYRVGILNLAAKNKEISIKDIESELGNGGANVYYHLSLMLKANLLRARNQGRAVIYRLNTPYFNSVRDLLLRYAEPENEDSTS